MAEIPCHSCSTVEDIQSGAASVETRSALPIARKSDELHLALSAARMALWRVNLRLGIFETNPQLNAVLGLAPDAKPTLDEIRSHFADGELERIRLAAHDAMEAGEHLFDHEFRFVWPNGQERWLLLRSEFVLDDVGALIWTSGIVMDVTERKHAEQEKDKALARVQMLVREMSHRIKNNLQMVSSLLSMQQCASTDPHARECLSRARERVSTIARLHNSLYRTADFESLDTQEYLSGLCRHIGEVMVAGRPIAFITQIESHPIGIDRAVPLGLVVNELVTNAVKHAFGEGGGEIRVSLTREGDELVLRVKDTGKGLPCVSGKGLGMRMVRVFADQLGGTLTIREDCGTFAQVRMPAS
jgi:PAS domain S-box-containing protein